MHNCSIRLFKSSSLKMSTFLPRCLCYLNSSYKCYCLQVVVRSVDRKITLVHHLMSYVRLINTVFLPVIKPHS